jgi:flavodoxin
MAKTLVIYFSQTENTKKIAESIHAALHGEKTIKSMEDVQDEDLLEFSLLFIGFPVHSHSVPHKAEFFLKRIPKGKKIALFCTHGSLTGSHLSREALEHAAVISSQAKILGIFSSRGKVSAQAMDVLSRSPEHKAWSEMAASARSHPNEKDMEDAKAFARWVQTVFAQD